MHLYHYKAAPPPPHHHKVFVCVVSAAELGPLSSNTRINPVNYRRLQHVHMFTDGITISF